MEYGKIVRFDAERGFGFIAPDRGGPDMFLHVSALERGSDVRQLRPGVQVSYAEGSGPRGTKAVQVQVIALSAEDAWPEYASPAPLPVQNAVPVSEEALTEVLTEAVDLVLARCRQRGWV